MGSGVGMRRSGNGEKLKLGIRGNGVQWEWGEVGVGRSRNGEKWECGEVGMGDGGMMGRSGNREKWECGVGEI